MRAIAGLSDGGVGSHGLMMTDDFGLRVALPTQPGANVCVACRVLQLTLDWRSSILSTKVGRGDEKVPCGSYRRYEPWSARGGWEYVQLPTHSLFFRVSPSPPLFFFSPSFLCETSCLLVST